MTFADRLEEEEEKEEEEEEEARFDISPCKDVTRFAHVNGMIFVRRLDSWDLLTFRPLINVEEAGDRVSGTTVHARVYRAPLPTIVSPLNLPSVCEKNRTRERERERERERAVKLIRDLTKRSLVT